MEKDPLEKKLRLDPPNTGAMPLGQDERAIVDTVHGAMRNWLDESVDRLAARLREDTLQRVGEARDEFTALMSAELAWEGELEERVRRLEAFEIEYGSEKTASETRALMSEVSKHLADRRARWESIRSRLEGLIDHDVLK